MEAAAPAIAGLLGRLSNEEREASQQALGAAFRERFGEGPATLPVAFNVAIAAP